MSFLALEVLQSLEHARASARFLFSGREGHGELWIEEGEIKQVEGCTIDSLRKLLTQSPVEIWVRPHERELSTTYGKGDLTISDLALEAAAHYDSGKAEMLSSRNRTKAPKSAPVLNDKKVSATPDTKLKKPSKKSKRKILKETPQLNPDFENTTISPFKTTANQAVHTISKAVEPYNHKQVEENEAVQTQPYHMIRFNLALPEKKVIGRSSRANVVIIDKQVSKLHCEVHYDGENITITDLDSSNGTFLNGNRVREATAAFSHDVIQVGRAFCLLSIV
ncbi:MAG: FHA domain-containing protein [Verrucomicrobiota bacterium]